MLGNEKGVKSQVDFDLALHGPSLQEMLAIVLSLSITLL